MSKRLDVLFAVRDLVRRALPDIDVRGLDNDDRPPRIGPGGMVIIRAGDPGDPEIDLSPPCYNFSHRIPIEIAAGEYFERSPDRILDRMLGCIGRAVDQNRTLGGLVDYLDATAPDTDDLTTTGSEAAKQADLILVADYHTSDPLN